MAGNHHTVQARPANRHVAVNNVELIMSILNRKMDPDERELIYEELEKNKSKAYGNLIWALLNTPEFFFIK